MWTQEETRRNLGRKRFNILIFPIETRSLHVIQGLLSLLRR